ncbi:MAG: hypothetical protein JWN64_59 [Parcubacteria group bacterium]|nr:hypothetical protein [Parcubacteria group bacterium]
MRVIKLAALQLLVIAVGLLPTGIVLGANFLPDSIWLVGVLQDIRWPTPTFYGYVLTQYALALICLAISFEMWREY